MNNTYFYSIPSDIADIVVSKLKYRDFDNFMDSGATTVPKELIKFNISNIFKLKFPYLFGLLSSELSKLKRQVSTDDLGFIIDETWELFDNYLKASELPSSELPLDIFDFKSYFESGTIDKLGLIDKLVDIIQEDSRGRYGLNLIPILKAELGGLYPNIEPMLKQYELKNEIDADEIYILLAILLGEMTTRSHGSFFRLFFTGDPRFDLNSLNMDEDDVSGLKGDFDQMFSMGSRNEFEPLYSIVLNFMLKLEQKKGKFIYKVILDWIENYLRDNPILFTPI